MLILLPRYPERFTRASKSAKPAGLMTDIHSQGEACSAEAQCFVIDTIGELMTYYACGVVAFVGGSLGDQGGHTPLEPAALGNPVLLGPNMVNAREIADSLINCDSARCVTNQQEFRETAETILTNGTLRDSMGQAGRSLVDRNKGALDLTLAEIKKLL